MSGEPKALTPPWAYYRRTGLSEMRPYVPGEDLKGISVSAPDMDMLNKALEHGADPGGYVARNPKNHADQWYVAQAYFDENLEPADTPEDEASTQCRWKADADEWRDVWWESCSRGDNGFIFETGGPLDNGFKFCPFCGRKLVEAEVEEG